MTAQLPPVPPGPADTTHPRRALARLALSYAYREVADFAAGSVIQPGGIKRLRLARA